MAAAEIVTPDCPITLDTEPSLADDTRGGVLAGVLNAHEGRAFVPGSERREGRQSGHDQQRGHGAVDRGRRRYPGGRSPATGRPGSFTASKSPPVTNPGSGHRRDERGESLPDLITAPSWRLADLLRENVA